MAKPDEWLNRELTAKLLALAVAVTLWVVVVFDEQGLPKSRPAASPVERIFNVSLAVRGVGPGLVVTQLPGAVGLRVRGSLEALKGSAAKVRAELNLAGQREGQTLVKVDIRVPAGLEVLSVEPSSAPVTLERVLKRVFPVRVGLIGSPDTGHAMGVVGTEPATAEVEGPSGRVARVKYVMAFVEVKGAAADLAQTVSLRAMDDNASTVEGVTIAPDRAAIVIPIYKLPVPVQAEPSTDAAGVPAPASRGELASPPGGAVESPVPAVQPPELPASADPAAVAPGEPVQ